MSLDLEHGVALFNLIVCSFTLGLAVQEKIEARRRSRAAVGQDGDSQSEQRQQPVPVASQEAAQAQPSASDRGPAPVAAAQAHASLCDMQPRSDAPPHPPVSDFRPHTSGT